MPRLSSRYGIVAYSGSGMRVPVLVPYHYVIFESRPVLDKSYQQKCGQQDKRHTCHMDADVNRIMVICSVLYHDISRRAENVVVATYKTKLLL